MYPRTMFTPLEIQITAESKAGAEMALAWFQMGQTEPVTIEIDDDFVKVHLDDEYLSFPFDDNNGNDRDVYAFTYGGDRAQLLSAYGALIEEHHLTEDQAQEVSDVIDEMFAELGSFAYGAAAAAIDTLTTKGN